MNYVKWIRHIKANTTLEAYLIFKDEILRY
jgi:hypothetical protein